MPKVSEAQQDQIRSWVLEWGKRLNLDHYTISVKFYRRRNPDDDEDITFADTTTHYAGLEAEIRVWKDFWTLSALQQERVCVHELVHVLAPTAIEDEVCRITEVLWRLVKGNV